MGSQEGTTSQHPSSQKNGSRRRGSMSLSRDGSISISEDNLDEVFAQAGDSGNRVIDDGGTTSVSQRFQSELGFAENGKLADAEDASMQSGPFRVHPNEDQIPKYLSSHIPPDAVMHSREDNLSKSALQVVRSLSIEGKKYKPPRVMDYLSYLMMLAVFGQLGALTRHLLQKLFGPQILAFTSEQTSFYLDLPSNMVGSFLMGWFGVVFKGDIAQISDHLAVGLSTGYLGSLTTFSGWNQKMLELSSKDHWVFAVAGIIVGMLLVNESINIGVESAGWLRKCILSRLGRNSDGLCTPDNWKIDRPSRQMAMLLVMTLFLISLWAISGTLAAIELSNISTEATLWLGCLVGPPGVWARWFLARLNGRGIGRNRNMLKWLPIGTLSANILAACVMASLAITTKAVNKERSSIILGGIQFGLLGCMSTVSTFAAEVYAMRQSGHPGRALAYSASTLIPSFALGTLIYSVPVWVKHYV